MFYRKTRAIAAFAVFAALAPITGFAQASPYGSPITVQDAKRFPRLP